MFGFDDVIAATVVIVTVTGALARECCTSMIPPASPTSVPPVVSSAANADNNIVVDQNQQKADADMQSQAAEFGRYKSAQDVQMPLTRQVKKRNPTLRSNYENRRTRMHRITAINK